MASEAVFVDTGAWFAAAVPSDPDHESASQFFRNCRGPVVTTDYIVDELLTLFATRGRKRKANRWLHKVLWGGGVALELVTSADFDEAIRVYQRFGDKTWSFTDCTSYVVVERLGVSIACSFDIHFRQFGIVQVVP
jgi:predicted nucleic acid-binding protein